MKETYNFGINVVCSAKGSVNANSREEAIKLINGGQWDDIDIDVEDITGFEFVTRKARKNRKPNSTAYGDKIFKLMQSLERNLNKPDLHSFRAEVKNGIVFVEGRPGEVFINYTDNDNEQTNWVGTYMAITNWLEINELDLSTVDM